MNPDNQYQQPGQFGPQPGQPLPPPPQPGYTPIPPQAPAPVVVHRQHSVLWIILTFVFLLLAIGASIVGVWAYMNYLDQKDNVDAKVSEAVAVAVKDQADKDAADFLEKEKQPNRQFAGPDDYGGLRFDYPKTWSVYEAKDASSGGDYTAYFNPGVVPPVSNSQQYALRVTIEDRDYDDVVDSYANKVKNGELVSSSVKLNEQNGTRLDGAFSKDIRGSAVIFKIRDKTVTVRTDADTFKGDFDALILTIGFNA